MIVCEACETGRFLHIMRSAIHFDADDGGCDAIDEHIECTVCELEGTYHYRRHETGDKEDVSGGLVLTGEMPVTAASTERIPAGGHSE